MTLRWADASGTDRRCTEPQASSGGAAATPRGAAAPRRGRSDRAGSTAARTTGPPGPVIPSQRRAGAVFPRFRRQDGRPPRSCRSTVRCSAMAAAPDLTALAARVYAASHLTGTFTLRSGVTSSEYFDKYRFEADPALLRRHRDALAPLVPAGCGGAGRARIGRRPDRDDAVAAHRTPGPLRAQGGEDLRHLRGGRGRRRRRHAGLHRRRRGHVRRRDPRRRGRAPGTRRGARNRSCASSTGSRAASRSSRRTASSCTRCSR